jgi:hypothetical protein
MEFAAAYGTGHQGTGGGQMNAGLRHINHYTQHLTEQEMKDEMNKLIGTGL